MGGQPAFQSSSCEGWLPASFSDRGSALMSGIEYREVGRPNQFCSLSATFFNRYYRFFPAASSLLSW